MKRQNVENCSFSNWYPTFKSLTIRSKIIKLPKEFIDYLNDDGVVLPNPDAIGSRSAETDPDWAWDNSDCEDEAVKAPEFPELANRVDEAIQALGGTVFPKLNWSAPRDASWITKDGTLKCSCFDDICLLLKSSDFIVHDLRESFSHCEDNTEHSPPDSFELVLRKWMDINPGMEFRIFVKKNQLIAISQRDCSNFFDYLLPLKNKIHKEITDYFRLNIIGQFPDSDYVYDVYRYADAMYKLLDFNPFNAATDSLLFTWKELINSFDSDESDGSSSDTSETEVEQFGEMRIVVNKEAMQPSSYLSYRMPTDMLHLSCGEDINKMIDFFNVKNLIQKPGDPE